MSNNLCWNCQNACGGCSWSGRGKPVKGWTAEPSRIKAGGGVKDKYVDTYHITSCPEFKPDTGCTREEIKRNCGRPINAKKSAVVRSMRASGKKYREIQSATGLSRSQVGRILDRAGMTKRQEG